MIRAILSSWCDEAGRPDGKQLPAACPLDRRWQELPPHDRRVEPITRNVLDRLCQA